MGSLLSGSKSYGVDKDWQVGDLVEVLWEKPCGSSSKRTLALVVKKEKILSKIQYDIYYPSEGTMSYGWEGWELDSVRT